MPALAELEQAAAQAWDDPAFTGELERLLKNYVGRATPLYEAEGVFYDPATGEKKSLNC